MNKIRNLGSNKKFIHVYVSMNSRLDTIQASILSNKLKRLNIINKKSKKNCSCFKFFLIK